jgi:hypothetical protein
MTKRVFYEVIFLRSADVPTPRPHRPIDRAYHHSDHAMAFVGGKSYPKNAGAALDSLPSMDFHSWNGDLPYTPLQKFKRRCMNQADNCSSCGRRYEQIERHNIVVQNWASVVEPREAGQEHLLQAILYKSWTSLRAARTARAILGIGMPFLSDRYTLRSALSLPPLTLFCSTRLTLVTRSFTTPSLVQSSLTRKKARLFIVFVPVLLDFCPLLTFFSFSFRFRPAHDPRLHPRP